MKIVFCLLAGLVSVTGFADSSVDVWVNTNITERYDGTASHLAGPTVNNGNNPQRALNGPYWQSGADYTFDTNDYLDKTLYFTNEVSRLQSLRWTSNERDYKFGTIVGDIWHRFDIGTYSNSRKVQLRNALDFEGVCWLNGAKPGSYCSVQMMGDGDKTTGFHQLRTQDYLTLKPMLAGQDILLRHIYGQGLWAIYPDAAYRTATITIEDSQSGNAADLNINNRAQVTLKGPTYATPTLVGTPVFHLDASVASSLSVSDGRVTEWRDLAGSGNVARPMVGTYFEQTLGYPTLRTDPDAQLPVVDLGVYVGTHGSLTPSWTAAEYGEPAVLMLQTPIMNVREVFIVVKDKHNYDTVAQFMGGEGTICFRRGFAAFGAGAEIFTLPYLFADLSKTEVNRAMSLADVRYDGQRVDPASLESLAGRLHTVSVGAPENLRLDYFGHDGGTIRCGGVQIAEVIVYATALTSFERREVNAYLKKKWMRGEATADRDYGKVRMDLENTVTVGSGNVSVRELQLDSDKTSLIKKGAGTFAFAKTAQKSLSVDVQAGGVRFTRDFAETTDDTKPAANPIIWFDASKKSSIVWHDEAKQEIESWKDCRDGTNYMGVSVLATYVTGEHKNGTLVYAADQTLDDGTVVKAGDKPKGDGVGAYPTYVEQDSVGGYPCVDFGKWVRPGNHGWGKNLSGSVFTDMMGTSSDAWATASYLKILLGGQKNFGGCVREAFVVARPTDSAVHIKWFGSTSRDIYPDAGGSAAYVGGNSFTAFSALFSRNGKSLVSGMDNAGNANGVRVCTGVRFTVGTPLNAIAYNADGGQGAGSGRFNEIVYYDRVLTEAERRQTEAYLMKKWGIGDHPYVNRAPLKVPVLNFADGVDPVIDSDRALTVSSVTTAEDTLVKKGTGDVTLEGALRQTNVTVSVGALAASVAYSGPFTNALVHYDASDLSTMDWAEATLTDGTVVTNVTRWYDVRSRTAYSNLLGRVFADSPTSYFGAGRLPRLKRMETREGSGRFIPVMDFGEPYVRTGGTIPDAVQPAGCGENDDAAMMVYTTSPTATEAITLTSIREAFVIIRDNPPTNGSPWQAYYRKENILGGKLSTNADSFQREGASNGKLLDSSNDAGPSAGFVSVRDGYASVDDGEADHPRNVELPSDGFHLVWFAPTNNAISGGLAFSRMRMRGGVAVAELAIFDHVLTDEKRAEIKASLMAKWFNGTASGTVGVGALTVAKDAELTLSTLAGVAVLPTAITNAGTFRVTGGMLAIPGGGLDFTFTSPTTCSKFVVDSTLDLTGGGTFVVDFGGRRVRHGSYELIRAASFTGTLENWTLQTKNLNGPRRIQLRQTATSICLDILSGGVAVSLW